MSPVLERGASETPPSFLPSIIDSGRAEVGVADPTSVRRRVLRSTLPPYGGKIQTGGHYKAEGSMFKDITSTRKNNVFSDIFIMRTSLPSYLPSND